MKLSIDIDDAELNALIVRGIKDLDKDTVSNLAKEAIMLYLQSNDGISNLLYKPCVNYYDRQKELRPEILKMLLNSFSQEEIEDYRQIIFATMENEGPHLLTKVLAEIFSSMLVTDDFKYKMQVELARLANS